MLDSDDGSLSDTLKDLSLSPVFLASTSRSDLKGLAQAFRKVRAESFHAAAAAAAAHPRA